MLRAGFQKLAQHAEKADLRRFAKTCNPAMIYLAGFAGTNFRLIELMDLQLPILTHVHEFGLLFRAQAGSALPRMLSATHRFIACSGAVKTGLVSQHKVKADRVDIVHEAISVNEVKAQRARPDVLQEVGFPDDAFLVVGCGNVGTWTKGTDIFVQLAANICPQRSRAYFLWVGAPPGLETQQLEHDTRMLGLDKRVRFVGIVEKPSDYFSTADVFVLPSREDSFPLVCLEAAALAKPIVCFADAGGMPEFVEEDCGYAVPYLDVPAMADRIVRLLDCPDCRVKMGEAARRKVNRRHDVSVSAPRILEIIERTIAGE